MFKLVDFNNNTAQALNKLTAAILTGIDDTRKKI